MEKSECCSYDSFTRKPRSKFCALQQSNERIFYYAYQLILTSEINLNAYLNVGDIITLTTTLHLRKSLFVNII